MTNLVAIAEIDAGFGNDRYAIEAQGRTTHTAMQFLALATVEPSYIAG